MSETSGIIFLLGFFLLAIIWVIYTLRQHTKLMCCIVPAVVICVGFGYSKIGAFEEYIKYQSHIKLQKQARSLSKAGTDKILQRMLEHLKEHPKSAQGWYLLGRLYASQHQWQLAAQAFKRAVELEPANTRAAINEVQSLQVLNNQRLNNKLRKRLQVILEHQPNQPDVLAMLAMDARLNHEYTNEIKYLESLLQYIPASAVEAGIIRKALASAYNHEQQTSKPVNLKRIKLK